MATLNFKPAIELLNSAKSIAVCGHINPDGDSIGSTLALILAARAAGKCAYALIPRSDNVEQFDFLPLCKDLQPAKNFKEDIDLLVMVDVAVESRMGDANHLFSNAPKTLIIDHHEHCDVCADCIISDPSAAATGILVWDIVNMMGTCVAGHADEKPAAAPPALKDIATACLTALITDTGRFQYQNADARAFKAAAQMADAGAQASDIALQIYQRKTRAALELEALAVQRAQVICNGKVVVSWVTQNDFKRLAAQKKDAESLIDVIRQLDEVEIALMLREQKDEVRCSIRSKTQRDVAAIATSFGGGGHAAAAGFTISGSLEHAKEILLDALCKEFE